MTSWKTYKLGDILNFRRGHDLPKTDMVNGEIPVAGSNGIIGSHNVSTPIEPCITIGRSGNVGTPYIYDKCWAHNTVLYVDDFKGNDPLYLYYLLKTIPLASYGGGSAVPTLNRNHIHPIEIKHTPSLEEQRRIAGILGAIDDKIENNRRINTNLELQAQALYKQWFVDFEFPNEEGKPYKSSGGKMVDSELGLIPKGWSVGALSDLADITMGQSPNGKSFNENGEGIVFYQGRTEFGIRYPSIRLYTTEPTRYAEPMSVLLSVRAPVGDINIATQRCCIGRGVASIKSKTDDNAYMYCCLKELRPQLDQYNGEGTVFGSINRKELEGLALCIPKNEVISQFNNVVLGMDRQMLNLFQQTQNLTTLRDTLLPKLMNGEIKL